MPITYCRMSSVKLQWMRGTRLALHQPQSGALRLVVQHVRCQLDIAANRSDDIATMTHQPTIPSDRRALLCRQLTLIVNSAAWPSAGAIAEAEAVIADIAQDGAALAAMDVPTDDQALLAAWRSAVELASTKLPIKYLLGRLGALAAAFAAAITTEAVEEYQRRLEAVVAERSVELAVGLRRGMRLATADGTLILDRVEGGVVRYHEARRAKRWTAYALGLMAAAERPPEVFPEASPERRAEAEAVVHAAVEEMIAVLRADASLGLSIPASWRPPRVKFDWSPSRVRSMGGTGGKGLYKGGAISLAMTHYVPATGPDSRFTEYDHVARDREIGTVKSGPWQGILWVLVAHELAHVVELAVCRGIIGGDAQLCRESHGRGWQQIYRLLRVRCANPRLASGGCCFVLSRCDSCARL